MKFLRKSLEYNKLAQAFNGQYQMLQNLLSNPDAEDFENDLLTLAYIGRREILNRMEEYNWKMNGRIVVPMMPGNQKTLADAYQNTIGRLLSFSEEKGYYSEVKDILDGGELYGEFDQNIPEHLKKML